MSRVNVTPGEIVESVNNVPAREVVAVGLPAEVGMPERMLLVVGPKTRWVAWTDCVGTKGFDLIDNFIAWATGEKERA